MTTEPGQVYKVDLGITGKVRMVVVVSMKDPQAPRATSVCVPITTAFRNSWYEVPLGRKPFLREQSWANTQGIHAFAHRVMQGPIGRLHPAEMDTIRAAIARINEIN